MKDTTLLLMNYIYNPDGYDWMNFKERQGNLYTYHHIQERRNGGHKTVENGAILTHRAHDLLNMIEVRCPKIYDQLQEVFRRINASNEPPTNDDIKEIDLILYRVLFTTEGKDIKQSKILRLRKEYIKCRKGLRNNLE